MKSIKPLMLSLSVLALACGSAYAQDTKKQSDTQAKPSMSQSGGSSASGGASAKRDVKSSQYDFDKADKDKDGKLSRSEFNEMMKGSAAGGGTAGAGQTRATPSESGSAKPQTPSSAGKADEKPKSSK